MTEQADRAGCGGGPAAAAGGWNIVAVVTSAVWSRGHCTTAGVVRLELRTAAAAAERRQPAQVW